jgi:hypothetical protein
LQKIILTSWEVEAQKRAPDWETGDVSGISATLTQADGAMGLKYRDRMRRNAAAMEHHGE